MPLSPRDLDAYRAIAAGDAPHDGQPVDRLLALGLISADPGESGHYLAAEPRAAAQRLMAAAQADLTRTVQRMAHIPAIEGLARHFDGHRMYGGPGSELLESREAMNIRIGEVSRTATTEILTAQPGEPADRDPEIQRLGVDRTRRALERGLTVQSLYNVIAWGHDQTRNYVDVIVAAGADVRASENAFPRMMIIDGTHAFVDNVIAPDDRSGGWHLIDRAAVMWVRSVYLLLWGRATPWGDLSHAVSSGLSERQSAILRELATGASQAQAGGRLGLADRTIGKELSAIKITLGAQSLYQVMAWWGREQHL
ncbi:hypothetical protein DVH02_11715 [Streptomyces corynorhini]|uniref:HTH luxR-type domain-containing protein n=1 Tax=Streptomyces corynorhini TaxID=2282652 RepID=A0A370BE62_9ACTN|nr:hypothetical protein DVH02_11715 [Streptomyces corynorhini]